MPVRYFEVSNSWNPSSPKLNTWSFMRWMSSRMPSTSSATSFLYCSSFGFAGADAAGAGCCAGAAVSDTVTATTAPTTQKRVRYINESSRLERDSRTDPHDARRNNAQWPQERASRVVAGVLLGVGVEQIEQIQEPRDPQ